MKKLIEALTIFLKYGDHNYPTHCEHDILLIMEYDKDTISREDQNRLDELGFFWDDEYGCWASYYFGSA